MICRSGHESAERLSDQNDSGWIDANVRAFQGLQGRICPIDNAHWHVMASEVCKESDCIESHSFFCRRTGREAEPAIVECNQMDRSGWS